MGENMSKTIAILGATGSVGTQALDVSRNRGYNVDLISANSNEYEAEKAAREAAEAETDADEDEE